MSGVALGLVGVFSDAQGRGREGKEVVSRQELKGGGLRLRLDLCLRVGLG